MVRDSGERIMIWEKIYSQDYQDVMVTVHKLKFSRSCSRTVALNREREYLGELHVSLVYSQMCNYQSAKSSPYHLNRLQTSLAVCQEVPLSFPVRVVRCGRPCLQH